MSWEMLRKLAPPSPASLVSRSPSPASPRHSETLAVALLAPRLFAHPPTYPEHLSR